MMKTIDGKSPHRTLSTPHLVPVSWFSIADQSLSSSSSSNNISRRKTNVIASMFQSVASSTLNHGQQSALIEQHDYWPVNERHHRQHQRSSSIAGFLSMKQRGRLKLLRQASAVPNLSTEQTVNIGEASSSSSSSGGAMEAKASRGVATTAGSRSVSLASVSSDGSGSDSHQQQQQQHGNIDDQHVVEQEDIVALTQEVRAFKEALGKLRRLFNNMSPDPASNRDKCDAVRVAAHERLGDVLRILRLILERYPALQSAELLVAAGSLIHQVKEHRYDDEKSDVKEFMESIDQLAMAFSSRVSEYLMGDLDGSASLAGSSVSSKTKSCENLASPDDVAAGFGEARKSASVASVVSSGASSSTATDQTAGHQQPASTASTSNIGQQQQQQLSAGQMDAVLVQLEQGVEVALHRAKLWSKYAKDIMTYVEKRCNLEVEFAKNVAKLAQTMKSALKEECYLPFQSVYITAMDREIDNCNSAQTTTSLLAGHKFLEPLTARRTEHERCRKQIKETWHRELKRMQEAVTNLRKAKTLYAQRQQEWERAKDASQRAESGAADDQMASRIVDKRKKTEEDALQKAMEAETAYRASVCEANERHGQLLRVKSHVLQQVRELMLQCDQTMKAVTVSYFQLQHTASAPAPVQFQTLCESSRLYEPGSQYMEFIRRMPLPGKHSRDGTPTASPGGTVQGPYTFEPYSEEATTLLEKDRKSNGSLSNESNDSAVVSLGKERAHSSGPIKAWSSSAVSAPTCSSSSNVVTQVSSDTESVESSPSAKSRETSPTASPMMPARRLVPASSGDELENEPDTETDASYMGYASARRHCMSKAAVTHTFRKLKTPSRCRECDSYVYFQGAECVECGLGCHKKCLESLTIQCGHKRLPRKMTTFGVDLSQHLAETGAAVPHLLAKCIGEIDNRGIQIKGLYRVSGVKSKVEKLCQSFENGADLVDLTDVHPNVIANVLKLYLRQLPEPLLTSRLYPDFIRVTRDWTASADSVQELSDLVHRLPRHHYTTLAFLMHHLKRVALEQESNNMPASNLGIVFGPTLLRTSEGSATLSSLVDTVHQTRVVELLIDHADAVFGPPEVNTVAALSSAATSPVHHRPPAVAAAAAAGKVLELETAAASLLSKVAVVRSISFLEKHRSKSRDAGATAAATDQAAVISTPSDRRSHELREEVLLPGFVADKTPNSSLDIDPDDALGAASDDDLPDFLLPDDSSKARKLPGYLRSGSAPKIFKASLKDYHGLEGVDLNLLSSQDQETAHPATPSRGKKSVSESSAPTSVQLTEIEANHSTTTTTTSTTMTVVQTTSSVVKTMNPYMDSSIDSDHSWESHSTGSSGRGTQHSDQGSVGSVQRALLVTAAGHDETDGRIDVTPFASLHRVSQTDENRVKIQVPSAATWNFGPASIASIESSSSSSSSSSSRGVVTVLEGPQSGTTIVECLANDTTTTTVKNAGGGGRTNNSNMAAALVVSDLAAVPVGLTHEFTFARSSVVRSSSSTSSSSSSTATTTTSSTLDVPPKKADRVPRFV